MAGGWGSEGEPMDDDLGFTPREMIIHPVKVIRLYKFGTDLEPDHGRSIALVGEGGMPVFRGPMLHPFHVMYAPATAGLPTGCLIIGDKVDIVACAVTCAFSPSDREMLQGMKISINFVPDSAVVESTEAPK